MRVLLMMYGMAMGGAERNIVSVLPYFARHGAQVTFCTLTQRWDSEPLVAALRQAGIERIDLGARRMTDLTAWKRFAALVREGGYHVLHTQDQDTHLYGGLARRVIGIPLVMTRHVMFEPASTLKRQVRGTLVKLAGRFSADRIIAVSEAVRQRFARQASIPLSRIETVYNGIVLENFETRQRRTEKRIAMGWALDRPIVIMVAVLREGKGHEVLFQAIPRLQQAVPNVQIKLIGDGPLGESLRAAAPPGDVVEFLGQRDDVGELLGASDVLVLPSWSEALPTVLIEAGAAKLPVVATNVGGTAEIVEHGKTGYIIPPGDALQLSDRLANLLNDSNAALRMGQAAYERVTSLFSLDKQAQQTVAVYQRVLDERKTTAP